MNYLTNYYKNLSEQLEYKLRVLEHKARELNEATMATYNVYGKDTSTPAGSWDNSWKSGIPGDYNGDGRVTGADLGLALAHFGEPGFDFQQTLRNWSPNQGGASPAMRSTSGSRGTVSSPNMPGDYNGDGRVDGADLGLALGRGDDPNVVLRNWTGNQAGYRSAQAGSLGKGGLGQYGGQDAMSYGQVSGDYNGDGRVDGADIGLALGRGENPGSVMANWGGRNPSGMETTGGYSRTKGRVPTRYGR